MGTQQSFRTTTSWDQAIPMLDTGFPLACGSHADVAAYLVHFQHLAAILTDGSVTALRHPGQFIDMEGNPEAPESILLEQNGIQVEIEPRSHSASSTTTGPQHRLQLLTMLG